MSTFPSLTEQDYELSLPADFAPAFAALLPGEKGDAFARLTDRLLETTEALVLVLNGDGSVLRMNAASEQLSGFRACEVVGQKLWEALANAQDGSMFRSVLRQVQHHRDPVRVEATLRTADQQPRTVAWSLAAVNNAEGGCELVVASGVDVTRRCRAEEQVRSLKQQAKVQMFADGYRERRSEIIISDRRTQPRQPYPYYQLIAPIVNGALPRRNQFQHLRCIDISPGGFSFVSAGPPAADSYVVALGNPPQLVYLQALVAHVRRLDESGEQGYSIGCSYTGRVEC